MNEKYGNSFDSYQYLGEWNKGEVFGWGKSFYYCVN